MIVTVEQTPNFKKIVKKLHASLKKNLDEAVKQLMENPQIGELKVGDLAGVRVFKFEINKQKQALAYFYHEDLQKIDLLTLGSHENFYRDLKKHLKKK